MAYRGRRLTDEEKEEILRLRKDGWTNGEIAEKICITENTVSRVCIQNGVSSKYFRGGVISRTLDIVNIPNRTEKEAIEKEKMASCAVVNRAISVKGIQTGYFYVLNAKNKTTIIENGSGSISIHISEIDGLIDELLGIKEKLKEFNVGAELI